MDENILKNNIESINQSIDIFKIEISNFVVFDLSDSLLEEIQDELKLKNTDRASKLLKRIQAKLEKNIQNIKSNRPRREFPFWRNFLLMIFIMVVLVAVILLGLQLIFGNVDQQTSFRRWLGNLLFCGTCFGPPSIFLWIVVFPRLFNDFTRNKLEMSLIHDFARIVVIRNYLEENSKK